MRSFDLNASVAGETDDLLPEIPEHIRPLFLDSTKQKTCKREQQPAKQIKWLMDMVHANPGEPLFDTKFIDPKILASYGYNAKVVGEGRPPHVAITWDDFDQRIFPKGSEGRAWVEETATHIDQDIDSIQSAGLKAFYWFDICVLPRTLVSLYRSELFGTEPETKSLPIHNAFLQMLHRYTIEQVFKRFPSLDGLVIRTGEIYTMNTPFHQGFSVIDKGPDSHIKLLNLLREEVAVKHDRQLFYRTWSFDKFHSDPAYLKAVSAQVDTHPNLTFIIKHTQVDFWRGVEFNPTLSVGKHPRLVEIQCQREYEGKGAYPNYVAKGVISGFVELLPSKFSSNGTTEPVGVQDIIHDPRVTGALTWSRGGGWRGPYITNEFWIELNVFVLTKWFQNTARTEKEIFHEFARTKGLNDSQARKFRELCVLSEEAVMLSQYISQFPMVTKTWMRDQYLGGADCDLLWDFKTVLDMDLKEEVLLEKAAGHAIWKRISDLGNEITFPDAGTQRFFLHSIEYGRLLYKSIYHSWAVTLEGKYGERTGKYNVEFMEYHLALYDESWRAYTELDGKYDGAPTIFLNKSFDWNPDEVGMYHPHPEYGMGHSVDLWRGKIELLKQGNQATHARHG